MNSYDRLRWLWAARMSSELVQWAEIHVAQDMQLPGMSWEAPLPGALLVARTVRMFNEDMGPHALEQSVSTALSGHDFISYREWLSHVRYAINSRPWPAGLPDAREAEMCFTELIAAGMAEKMTPAAVTQELSQRWGVADPRMLDYLSALPPAPFAEYVDFREVITQHLDAGPVQNILVNLWGEADKELTASDHSGAPEPVGLRPNHLVDLTEQMRLCLVVESKARAMRTRAPLGHDLLPAADRAIETVIGHRQRLAVMPSQVVQPGDGCGLPDR